MIELHLIGYTADLQHLVLDLDGDATGGRYRVVVDPDLFATLDEVRDEREAAGLEVAYGGSLADDALLPDDDVDEADEADEADEIDADEVDGDDGHELEAFDEDDEPDTEFVESTPPGTVAAAEHVPFQRPPQDEPSLQVGSVRVVNARPDRDWDVDDLVEEALATGASSVPTSHDEPLDASADGPIEPQQVDEVVLEEVDVDVEPLRDDEVELDPFDEWDEEDDEWDEVVAEEREEDEEPAPAPTVRDTVRAAAARPASSDSALSPAEIQGLLRAGRSPKSVAKAAGTDVTWVERWLPPIAEERARILRDAQQIHTDRSRLGRSGLPLGDAVRRNLADRRVDPDAAVWETARRADGRWRVSVRYASRGRNRVASWTFRPADGTLVESGELARELGWTRGRARAAASKAPATKTAAKKAAAKRSPATKRPAKKAASKKPAAKTPAKKKPAAKTPATKKTAAKTPAKKKPAAKKSAAKTPAKKKPAAKKASAKKATRTSTPRGRA